jgi:transglutaminase-like putative cysteine protease
VTDSTAAATVEEVVYDVTHRTTYAYGVRMSSGVSVAHLTPRATPLQRVLASTLTIAPEPDERRDWDDVFANHATFVSLHRGHDALELAATSTVAVVPSSFDLARSRIDRPWDTVVVQLDSDLSAAGIEARSFRVGSRLATASGPCRDYAAPSFRPGRDLADALAELCHRIFDDFEFDPSFSDVTTPVSEVLAHRRGVCQDFAHLALACLRSLRLPARYVSGYIETTPPPGRPKLVGSDASHAWVSVYVPGVGWIDLDPTNDQMPTRRHVTVAWGRDYADVAPVQGVVFGPRTAQVLSVAVDVTPRPRA